MRCSKCGSDNREGPQILYELRDTHRRHLLKMRRSHPAGRKILRRMRRCNWGSASRVSSSAQPSPLQLSDAILVSEVIDGERKPVTALFAYIKGSMELMEDLHPEEARAILDPALKLMMDAVQRYGGFVVQSTSDGIFALFGHQLRTRTIRNGPCTRHFECTRQCGTMANACAEKGLNLQLRLGANIGEVVVRTIQTGTEQTEYSPIGHSTSLAARLQTLATPGSTS
jgi:class 3 adenylate cyclase